MKNVVHLGGQVAVASETPAHSPPPHIGLWLQINVYFPSSFCFLPLSLRLYRVEGNFFLLGRADGSNAGIKCVHL